MQGITGLIVVTLVFAVSLGLGKLIQKQGENENGKDDSKT